MDGETVRHTPEGHDPSESHADTGGAAAAGAVTGAVVGTAAAGPLGTVIGGIGGAVAGALTERVMHGGEDHEHLEGDEVHFVGDHDHTGDDDGHDHSFHPPYTRAEPEIHEHRFVNGRCDCGVRSEGIDPTLLIPPGA